MADNILAKDRTDADITLAAKDNAGVLFPRNIIVTPAGLDLSPLTDDELRASPVPVSGAFYQATQPVSAASLPLPSGAATEATATAMRAMVDAMSAMTETMQYMLTSILEKMPRVDAADRLMVSHAESSPTVALSSNQTLQTLATMTNIGGRDAAHTAYALANAGALHIYDNIRVS